MASSWRSAPIQGFAGISSYIERPNPGDQILHDLGRKVILVAPSRANGFVAGSVTKKSLRQRRAGPSPVNKVIAEEDPICPGVGLHVERIRAAVGKAVMGVGLAPPARGLVSGIDVVSEGLLFTASEIDLFRLKARIGPIFLECHCAGYPHGEHKAFLSVILLRARSDDPVSNRRRSPNLRLAGCQGAHAKERVWREPIIPRHDV